jgi:galactokinase
VNTGFNRRVDECREAARRLLELAGQTPPADSVLSAVDPEVFASAERHLPDNLRLRAAHFFGETRRVREGREAWRRGDLERFGELMTESGESSIVNYECGTPPLVTLYGLLRAAPGVYGARFSGAGFGGSCVALVDPSAGDEVVASVASAYRERHPDLASRSSFELCGMAGPARLVRQ